MGDLLHARRIYVDAQDGQERQTLVSLLWDDVLDARSSKGVGRLFKNREPKTYVTLAGDRGMWLLIPYSRFQKMWEAFTHGEPCWDFSFSKN